MSILLVICGGIPSAKSNNLGQFACYPPERILNEEPRRWRYGTEEALYLVDEKRLEEAARKVLEDREREVFFRRYTLSGHPFMTQDEVAGDCGLTRQRIQQIQKNAEEEVRQALGIDDA